MSNKNKSIIQSVDKAIQIVNCLDKNGDLGITEISNILGWHKSTTYGLISTLSAHGILEKNDDTRKYALGLEIFRLGTKVNLPLRRVVIPHLEKLVNMYEETANLVMLQDTSVLYLEKVESSHSMRISTLVGGTKPVYCTAVGKAILAFLPSTELDNLLHKIVLNKYTDNTITNKQFLLDSLDEVKKKGYAIDREELEIGLDCVAAPILNQYKLPFAAISISGPSIRMTNELCKEIGKTLIEFTQSISGKLGYTK